MAQTLLHPDQNSTGRFCWLDLAASDASRAHDFYRRLFGWTPQPQAANGGFFTRLRLAGQDVGSSYQLSRTLLERGAESHWTPYIRVSDVQAAAQRAGELGGAVLVRPFAVHGVARIALILDAVGAQVGLWQSLDNSGRPDDG